ncbi:hypothetical protein ACKKBF_B31605 [Auxenochlorella protothecoides x Auxenochlorella symbiontica]
MARARRLEPGPRLVLALSLLLLPASVIGTCEGGACAGDHAAATAAGLLGSSAQSGLGACQPKKYPTSGSLMPITLDTQILDLVWVNSTEGGQPHVYAVTQDSGGFLGGPLWRSEEPGRAEAWRDITPMLTDLVPGKVSPYFGITNVLVSPALGQHILLQGRAHFHFTSRDGGKTFKAIGTPGNTTGFDQEILFHPKQPEWILAKTRRPSCSWYMRSSACGYDLYLTQDFGTSWRNLTEAASGRVSSFRDFDWGVSMPMYAGKPTPDEAIFATVFAGDAGAKGLYPGWDKDLHYVVSLDFFASPVARMVPCGNLFEVVASKVFLAVPSDCPLGADGKARSVPSRSVAGRTVTLYVSDWDGDDFTEVCLPSNLEDDGYNMVETHDSAAAFVLADHAEPGSRGPTSDSPTSDAYAPAYNASMHTLSLRNVFRRDFLADFMRVEGLPGMFIANRVDPLTVATGAVADYGAYLQTVATRNGGADWSRLPLPTSFRYAQCDACPAGALRDRCSLHLHGPTSWASPAGPRPNLYSSAAAPGLLLATGNTGLHLDTKPSAAAACTWASRDGGLTWQDVADRPYIYEIGAGGDAVVAAGHASDGPTAKVRFTADAGACWHEVDLPEAILVTNIRVDPASAGTVFMVQGSACTRTTRHPDCTFQGGVSPPGKLFVIDLARLLGADFRACADADYEDWAAPAPGTCLLGRRLTLTRRRADAACFTPPGRAAPAPREERCACTAADDTECEYGFRRSWGGNASCEALPGLEAASCERWGNGVYEASHTHLRLVHGDVCDDPRAVIPDTDGKGGAGGGRGGGCARRNGGGRWGWLHTLFFVLLITGIVAVVGGVVWTQCLPPAARDEWAERASPALGVAASVLWAGVDAVIGAWDWARFKWAELTHRGAAREAYFEPLSDRLDVDPEDHRSPPLFNGP